MLTEIIIKEKKNLALKIYQLYTSYLKPHTLEFWAILQQCHVTTFLFKHIYYGKATNGEHCILYGFFHLRALQTDSGEGSADAFRDCLLIWVVYLSAHHLAWFSRTGTLLGRGQALKWQVMFEKYWQNWGWTTCILLISAANARTHTPSYPWVCSWLKPHKKN